jgi:hypothetical protein
MIFSTQTRCTRCAIACDSAAAGALRQTQSIPKCLIIALQNDQRWCNPEGGNTSYGAVERRRLGSLGTGLLFSVWRLYALPLCTCDVCKDVRHPPTSNSASFSSSPHPILSHLERRRKPAAQDTSPAPTQRTRQCRHSCRSP